MSNTADIIQRFRNAGIDVEDVRGQLPRNAQGGPNARRPLSLIKRIADHYDAVDATDEYDAMARIVSEAWYHIRKDWGGGSRGDGFMYHMVCTRRGKLYITRDFEDITWHVGAPNTTALAYKNDGGADQEPTAEQATTFQKVHEILCYQCPEIPASQKDVWGHKEMAQFGGTITACPGRFLVLSTGYRSTRSINGGFAAVTPAPTPPTPTPDPTPPPVVQSAAQEAVPVQRRVRVRNDWNGLRIRRSPNSSDVIGTLAKGAIFNVYQDRTAAGGYVWLKRVEDNFAVAEVGLEYL